MPQYSKTTWVDGSAPAISAANLNKLEQGVFDAIRQDGSTTMSAQLVTIAGTAATPAIAPTGDSNTGIFFPAADTIAFGEGGTEVMRINSSGNVGIGTTSPDVFSRGYSGTILGISSSGQSAIELNSGTGNTCYFDLGVAGTRTGSLTATSTDVTLGTIGAIPLNFSTNGSVKAVITSAGNVGIGTASPSAKLEVAGSVGSNQGLTSFINNTDATGYSVLSLKNSGASGKEFAVGLGGNGVTGLDLANKFYIFDTSAGARMVINSSGNVGIGTTSPSEKLHVAGNIILQTSSSTIANNYIRWQNNTGTNQAGIASYFNVADTGNIEFLNGTSTKMLLTSLGYLLIGYTSSNGAYPLQVNGQIFATSSTIATSDGRYKKDIVSLDGALDIVAALNPVQFNWKEHPVHKFNTDVPTVGFIAQEVAEVLKDKAYLTSVIKKSECIWETDTGEVIEREVTRDVETQVEREIIEEVDGEKVTRTITETIIEQVIEIVNEPVKETHTEEFYGIAESNMIAILTKAIQELKAEVDALKAQLAK